MSEKKGSAVPLLTVFGYEGCDHFVYTHMNPPVFCPDQLAECL